MMYETFYDIVEGQINDIQNTQEENIRQAAQLFAKCVMAGGVIQIFGNGHSFVGAADLLQRAGSLIQVKAINSAEYNIYEQVEGVGRTLMRKVDIRPEDVFVINTHSGRNPLGVEVAMVIKEHGNPLIVVSPQEACARLTSRHSSGKMVVDFADVLLDTKGVYGDAAVDLPGVPTKVAATSAITSPLILQCVVLEAIELMVSQGFEPPVYRSNNLDGQRQRNQALVKKFAHRLFRK